MDETYERTLQEIDKEKCTYAYRLLQCIAVACRPLHVEELAEFLAFDFEAGGCPKFRADWRAQDPRDTVLSTCSTLISIVDTNGSPLVQFSHFSVLEYLTSKRIQERVPHYYVPSEPAHLVVTQACLSVLLQLGDYVTKADVFDFPLARYAARHWVDHAKPESVSSQTEDEMKRIFDPQSPHFAAWTWICDVDSSHGDIPLDSIPETPPPRKPLRYIMPRCAAFMT
jgi:hypothetical protein